MDFKQTEIENLIKRVNSPKHPGVSVLVAKGDEILLEDGYGLSQLENAQPTAADTSYLIASVSKQFTCAAAMFLVEEGKLELDVPIDRYTPYLPDYRKQVTLRHLMTHTSGIPEYFGPEFRQRYCSDTGPLLDLSGLLAFIADTYPELEFIPGSNWAYSNSAYVILGDIVERVSDKPFDVFLREKIFDPLGMTDSKVGTSPQRPEKMAVGYHWDKDGHCSPAPYTEVVIGWADGNIISNCTDLLKWLRAVRNRRLLNRTSWDRILSPYLLSGGQSSNYGFGWFFHNRRGLTERWHTGSTVGYHCRVSCFDEDDVTIIWLLNSDPGYIGDLNIPFGGIVNSLFEADMDRLPEWKPVPPPSAKEWSGIWRHDPVGEDEEPVRFEIGNGGNNKLSLKGNLRGTKGDWPLLPESEKICWIDSDADYFLTLGGSTTGSQDIVLNVHGRELIFERENNP